MFILYFHFFVTANSSCSADTLRRHICQFLMNCKGTNKLAENTTERLESKSESISMWLRKSDFT